MPTVPADRKPTVPAVRVDELDLRMVDDALAASPRAVAQVYVLEIQEKLRIEDLTRRKFRPADEHRRPQPPIDLDRAGCVKILVKIAAEKSRLDADRPQRRPRVPRR